MAPRPETRKPSPKARKLVVGDHTWWWAFGGRSAFVWSPNGDKFNPHLTTLTGITWPDLERAHWKGGGDHYSVRPSHIRRWIDKFLDKGTS